MMHRNYVRPTAEEKRRNDRVMKLGCLLSRLRRENGLAVPKGRNDLHHLVMPGKREGHGYTVCLNAWYHRAVVPYPCTSKAEAREMYGASLADGGKSFLASHGLTDWQLWEMTQVSLGLPTDRPTSKRVARNAA